MAYEKYIRKNGKLYGPYTYHSKRVNGKVVSEYHGAAKKKPSFHFNYSWLIGIFIVLILIGVFLFWNSNFTGKVSLDINSNSQQGEALEGVLSLALKEGELIPTSSKVIIDIGENTYEYSLSDLVDAETLSGDFYVEGKEISGTGSGYGTSGTKTIYPEVDFTLNILSQRNSNNREDVNNRNSGGSSSGRSNSRSTEISTPEVVESVEVVEANSEESELSDNLDEEVVVEDEVQSEVQEEVESVSVEVSNEPGESSQDLAETIEVAEEESSPEPTPEQTSEPAQESSSEPVAESSPAPTESSPEVSVTGAVIANFFRNTFNAFLVLTGQASLKITQEVDGSVSFGESFTYDLAEGMTAEIKSGSVMVNGELADDDITDISVINNHVIVTTEYSEDILGFGEDYLGDGAEIISIDLSQLGVALSGDVVSVRLVYEDTDLVSVSTSLGEEETEVPDEELVANESEEEVSPEINVTNQTEISTNISNQTIINQTLENITEISNATQEVVVIAEEVLTSSEREVLEDKFGEVVVKVTNAKKVNDRIKVNFAIGSYSVDHSYSDSLTSEELVEWMERDRIRFLKDIADVLSAEKSSSKDVEGIVGFYTI